MTSEPINVHTTCRLCGSSRLTLAVPLAAVPIVSPNVGESGNAKDLNTVTAPLDHYLCQDCGLIQMVHVVDPSLIYRDYLYRTSISKGLPEHFGGQARAMTDRLNLRPEALVVEFGSNDGTLLGFFKAAGLRVQGIDPASAIAAEATRNGIPTIADFFTPDVARRILAEQGPADLVVSNNCMANIDDLASVLTSVETLLGSNGVFVFETQYAGDVFEKFLLDVIYHEHITCFSVRPVMQALPGYGLEVFDAEPIPTKGGSIRFWIQKKGADHPVSSRVGEMVATETAKGLYQLDRLRAFGAKATDLSEKVRAHIAAARERENGPIAAYGTSVGCIALIHQLELQGQLDFLVDDTPFKDAITGPGYRLPVLGGEALVNRMPSLVVVLAWRYADLIIAKQQAYLANHGRFLIPLPVISEIGGEEI